MYFIDLMKNPMKTPMKTLMKPLMKPLMKTLPRGKCSTTTSHLLCDRLFQTPKHLALVEKV